MNHSHLNLYSYHSHYVLLKLVDISVVPCPVQFKKEDKEICLVFFVCFVWFGNSDLIRERTKLGKKDAQRNVVKKRKKLAELVFYILDPSYVLLYNVHIHLEHINKYWFNTTYTDKFCTCTHITNLFLLNLFELAHTEFKTWSEKNWPKNKLKSTVFSSFF